MADLYFVDFSSMDVEELIKKYEDKVDRQRLSRITRTRADKARVRSLLGGYLLQVAVKDYLGISDENKVLDLHYLYGKHGKPYLADYPELFFSLSHSGNVVALVISEQEVVLDVQQYVTVKDSLAKRFFTEEEAFLLSHETDKESYERLFFAMWSIKESYIKFTGCGIGQGLDSFEIDFKKREISENKAGKSEEFPKQKVAVFEEILLPGISNYAVSICMKDREGVRVCTQKMI